MGKISVNNVAVNGLNGKIGNVRYFTRYGKTYTRVAGCQQTNPRSYTQQERRMKFASLCKLWNVLKYAIAGMMERENATYSDFNMFTKTNNSLGVYLEKDSLNVIALPVQVSKGPLSTIAYEMREENQGSNTKEVDSNAKRLVSDLCLKDLVIDESTTIKDFANAIIMSNTDRDFQFDDEIVFCGCRQMEKIYDETIYEVQGFTQAVPLDPNDTRLFWQVVNPDYFKSVGNQLGTATLSIGCYGYLHARKLDLHTTIYSNQRLENFNEVLIERFTSEEQFLKAGNTYGKMTKPL